MLRSSTRTFQKTPNNSVYNKNTNSSIKNNSLNQNRNLYTFQTAPKPDSKKPIPWRKDSVDVSQDQKLRTWVYNPFGISKRPPQPIIGIPDNLWGSGKIFSSILRHSNYPYGFVGMDLRARGGSQSVTNFPGKSMIKRHVEDYLKVLEHYHLVRSFVVAHGYGAYIAYKVAELYPEKISGIVLVDSGFPKIDTIDDTNYERRGFEVLSAKHLEGEYSSPGEIITAAGLPSKKPKELSVDEMSFYREVVEKQSNGKFKVKSNKEIAEKEFNELSTNLPSLQNLWKMRHPIGIVTANKNGVISEGDAKIMRDTLHTVGSVDVDAEHHNALLLYPNHAEHVAAQMDNLASLFDYQQRALRHVDNLKRQITQEQMEA